MTGQALLPVATPQEARAFARRMLRPYRVGLLRIVIVILTGVLAGLTVPPLLGMMVDRIVAEDPTSSLVMPLVLLATTTISGAVLAGWGRALVGSVGEQALADAREEVVGTALAQSPAQLENTSSGDLVARVGNDVDVVSVALAQAVPALIVSVLTAGLTLGGLAVLDWRLAAAGCLCLPWYLWAVRLYGTVSPPLYAAERRAEGDREQQVVAALEGAETVRALDLQDRHLGRIRRASEVARGKTIHALTASAWFFTRVHLGELTGIGAVLVVGAVLVADGSITAGTATAGALYFLRLFDPVSELMFLLDKVQSATAALARIAGVASLPIPAGDDAALPRGATVEVDELRFAYDDGPDVVCGVDLSLPAGQLVAVVGTSGAGKSTLGALIAGIHQPRAGRVRVAGLDTAVVDRRVLADQVTVVDQEPHVFSGTIADDLRLARPGATDVELLAALRTVGAAPWVEQLPDGIETSVGDGGFPLDAMHTAQLALARCLLRDTAVVVIDEPTADVGGRGLAVIEQAIGAVVAGRTAIVVVHRLSTAALADRVVVMADGRIVEDGPPRELQAGDGPYARLWEAWQTSTSA